MCLREQPSATVQIACLIHLSAVALERFWSSFAGRPLVVAQYSAASKQIRFTQRVLARTIVSDCKQKCQLAQWIKSRWISELAVIRSLVRVVFARSPVDVTATTCTRPQTCLLHSCSHFNSKCQCDLLAKLAEKCWSQAMSLDLEVA